MVGGFCEGEGWLKIGAIAVHAVCVPVAWVLAVLVAVHSRKIHVTTLFEVLRKEV